MAKDKFRYHMDTEEFFKKYSNLVGLPSKVFRPDALPPGLENMACELYNPGTEGNANKKASNIILHNYHPERYRMWYFGKTPFDWMYIVCKPGDWVFLPHGAYTRTLDPLQDQYSAILNFGDQMFKGNKLPSRPEVKKNFY